MTGQHRAGRKGGDLPPPRQPTPGGWDQTTPGGWDQGWTDAQGWTLEVLSGRDQVALRVLAPGGRERGSVMLDRASAVEVAHTIVAGAE